MCFSADISERSMCWGRAAVGKGSFKEWERLEVLVSVGFLVTCQHLTPKHETSNLGAFQHLVISLRHPSTLLSQPETCKLAVCLGMASSHVTRKRQKQESLLAWSTCHGTFVTWPPHHATRLTLLNTAQTELSTPGARAGEESLGTP